MVMRLQARTCFLCLWLIGYYSNALVKSTLQQFRSSRILLKPFVVSSSRSAVPAKEDFQKLNNVGSSGGRRIKKNKYQDFSQIRSDQDPLDILVEEAEQKNQILKVELMEQRNVKSSSLRRSKNASTPATSQLTPKILPPFSRIEFPDVRTIDPYDPSTFGYIEIGTIMGAHGVHGWVKALSATDFPKERLCTAGIRHIKSVRKRAPRKISLTEGRHCQDNEYLLLFEGIHDRDAASKLRGHVLYVREEQKVVPSNDEYLVSDLVGLNVFLATSSSSGDEQNLIGKIDGIVFADDLCSIPGLGHDYIEIALAIGGNVPSGASQNKHVLVPFVPQIVQTVDLPGQAVYIDPPAGLLDLTFVREEKVRLKGLLPGSTS